MKCAGFSFDGSESATEKNAWKETKTRTLENHKGAAPEIQDPLKPLFTGVWHRCRI
jgi:hypothetical protein